MRTSLYYICHIVGFAWGSVGLICVSLKMPPKKKTKVASEDADDETAVAVHQLEDIMADILGWLCVEEITCS